MAASIRERFTPRQKRLKAARRFPQDGCATVHQAAAFLECHTASVYRMVRLKKLHAVPIGASELRIPWPSLWAYINGGA